MATSVRKAGLVNLTGLAGAQNVQGEEVKKLDELSNDIFINSLKSSGRVSVMVSEENEKEFIVDDAMRGRYHVVFDPLDGSSNIDCGVSIGTIFGIYKSTVADNSRPTVEQVLRPGKEMVAAGYCMYGSSTVFILSTGNGVNGYTLDSVSVQFECALIIISFKIQSIGEFILTHPKVSLFFCLFVSKSNCVFRLKSRQEARFTLLMREMQCTGTTHAKLILTH